MPTKAQIQDLAARGMDYRDIGRRFGISAGLAYLIGTGLPADGGDTPSPEEREARGLAPASQDLADPAHENPTSRGVVHAWIGERVRLDGQMRAAGG
ncbi:hypothetical protein HFP15_33560 [Amycolatopsis sp. K13G38]|uniref:Helix-turn-helix domain-containing protein n=1 Tax=Amycolatopsis acididurans TaxID=2724524 RepID=A0ABX1JED1_9PSEU|nr:hypothetical protein [Amycolatopsis acididurans]NKQ57799.1 hypothetical protein [Amycolatopsis acididurans]